MEFIFFSVRVVENVGKIEIVLKKKKNTSWKRLGHPLENHNSLIPKKDTGMLRSHFEYCVHEIVVSVMQLYQSLEGYLGGAKGPLYLSIRSCKRTFICFPPFFKLR